MTNDRIRLCRFVILFFVVFVCFAGKTFAQNFDNLSEILKRGNDEQKRTALLQIRNLETAEASRIAVPALADSSEIVRATAASSVIYLPKDEAFAVLSPLLNDKKEFVRREAVYALGKIQNPSAIGLLIQIFEKDRKNKFPEVKNACLIALGEIGDVSALGFLTQILQRKPNETNGFERRSAARSVGQIAQFIQTGKIKVLTPLTSPPVELQIIETAKYKNLSEQFPAFRNSVPILTAILQSRKESDDTKRETAFALGAIGDANAVEILRSNLNAKDYYLAEISKEALEKIEIPAKPKE